jgi:hypothetical protein
MRIVHFIFQAIWRICIFALLTLLSQVGGLIYVVHHLLFRLYKLPIKMQRWRFWLRQVHFVALYLLLICTVVPWVAQRYGRVPLPHRGVAYLRPVNLFTCLLNRHYVTPELSRVAHGVAYAMHVKHEGTVTNYLEANFPFWDGYPLIPHLSHNDGRKLDIAFCYVDRRHHVASAEVPAWYGYGVCEEPRLGEEDRAAVCAAQGYWQYSWMKSVVPQQGKADLMFDAARTKSMIELFVAQEQIGKALLEPHLKSRLKLNNNKIRLHGCQAVRHDDHVHVQLK